MVKGESIEFMTLMLQSLTTDARKEVCQFIEKLKKKSDKTIKKQQIEEKILSVSVWSEKDLQEFETINKNFRFFRKICG